MGKDSATATRCLAPTATHYFSSLFYQANTPESLHPHLPLQIRLLTPGTGGLRLTLLL